MSSFVRRKTAFTAFVVLFATTVYYYRNIKTLSPILEISTGKLQGAVSYTRNGKEVYEYLQIPFAKPPVGNLRFEPPQPAESWVGVRDATENGPQCLQINMLGFGIEGSESCLFLKCFTPKLVFNWTPSAFIAEGHRDFKMSKQLVKLWADFVKNSSSLGINDLMWSTINVKESQPFQYLIIDVDSKMDEEPYADGINFWKKLGMGS